MNAPADVPYAVTSCLKSGVLDPATGSRHFTSSQIPVTKKQTFPALIALSVLIGALLRLYLPAGFKGIGFDENLYRTYLLLLKRVGILDYPILIESFIRDQFNPEHHAILPPTRLVYIIGGYVYHQVFGLEPLVALRSLSCHCSILTLVISAVFCSRMAGPGPFAATVTALVACAPAQIHLAQHTMIDPVFGCCALLVIWLLWENLRQPDDARWLIAYGVALALLVLVKESASFVFAAILGVFVVNRWANFGSVNRRLVLVTFVSSLAGLTVAVLAAGGFENFALVFILLKQKVPVLAYTIQTGDGPWHRYLIDLVLVSPVIMLLAIANLFSQRRHTIPGQGYLAAFSFLTYGVLASFPDGMNLRYILMLDMPLRVFAASQLFALSQNWGRRRNLLLTCAVLGLCAYELRQHNLLSVKYSMYELVTGELMRAQRILK